jgi:hypothetical protein
MFKHNLDEFRPPLGTAALQCMVIESAHHLHSYMNLTPSQQHMHGPWYAPPLRFPGLEVALKQGTRLDLTQANITSNEIRVSHGGEGVKCWSCRY